jgi:hypothetical protein
MKYLVKFTQVSHHTVGALVEADSDEQACIKARDGDNIEEFNLTDPESWELTRFFAKPISNEEAIKWVLEQEELNRE